MLVLCCFGGENMPVCFGFFNEYDDFCCFQCTCGYECENKSFHDDCNDDHDNYEVKLWRS